MAASNVNIALEEKLINLYENTVIKFYMKTVKTYISNGLQLIKNNKETI